MSRRESLDWIDNLPAEWSAVQLKYLLVSGNDAMKVGPFGTQLSGNDFTDDGYWVYNQRTVVDQNFEDNNTFVSEEKYNAMKSFQVEAGDILITTRGTIGRICKVPEHFHRGIIHPCIIKFRIDENKILYDLVRLLFNESDMIKEQLVYMSNATTIDVVYSGPLKNVFIPVAPIKTQRSISAYLDSKCAEIDALTADIQSQIDMLEQYKRSVITEVVTRGLDKNVEMKESGIEWAEQIPAHWRTMHNKYLMHKVKEICPVYNGEDILSLTMQGVIVRDFELGGKMPASFDGYQIIHPGNLLMCLFDYDVTPRCIGYINNEGLTSPAYSQFVMEPIADAHYYYYYYLMLDFTKELLHLAKNLRHSFTEEQLGEINTVVPPVNEQREIAGYLDKKVAIIDEAISLKNDQLSTLDTYKKSIIYEYVTGKKEVPAV